MAPRARVAEKTEQAHIVSTLRMIAGHDAVFTLGTVRKRGDHPGTMQSPGLPDVVAFLPSRRPPGETPRRVLLCVECKADGGRLSPQQVVFRNLCHDAEIAHVVGTFNAVIQWLCERGYAKPESFSHERQPQAVRA